uniref:Mediator complex subunit Med12 domain-containing protein n=1 Tax=Romanomermis culicivorax TaxID=13658 RepID=A0A915HQD2_ROMCU
MSDGWFKELAGNKPLTLLAKKFPFFNKREDIFNILVDFNVAMCRAVWFVKMTNAYLAQQQETGKIKRKQMTDPCLDWTISLTSFLRPLFNKLVEYFSSTSSSQPGITVDAAAALKQWQYCVKLARYMFEEGLLEKQEFLKWLLDVFSDKCQNPDEGSLKLILPVVMQYMDGILRSELLSRRLSYLCCKKLSIYYADTGSSSPDHRASPMGNAGGQWYAEFTKCSFHKSIVLSLSGIIQSILVDCPISLIWNGLKVNPNGIDSRSYLSGSPLDLLPCFPSQLPMPDGGATDTIRDQLKYLEQEVRQRSLAVDNRWSFDNRELSGLSAIVSDILNILESLDKYCYDRSNETNNLNTLYSRIFSQEDKDFDEAMEIVIIKFMCYYAITAQRSGSYRAIVIVRLLEKRKNECVSNLENGRSASYPFQNVLFEFLDTEAVPPPINDRPRVEFSNLILLFNEFIRADLFSHDAYLKCLISRGEIPAHSYQIYMQRLEQQRQSGVSQSMASSAPQMSNLQTSGVTKAEVKYSTEGSFLAADFNESKDSEGYILGQYSTLAKTTQSLIAMHMHTEDYKHESNQRQTLLFGCGSIRDSQKSMMKKFIKELNKLWHKKNSIECLSTGVLRLKRRICSDNQKILLSKFRSLVNYDQQLVMDASADCFLEQMREFICLQTSYLPNIDNVDYFLSLYEVSLNIAGLIEFVEAIFTLLPKLYHSFVLSRNFPASPSSNYVLSLTLCCIGFLSKYLTRLVCSIDELKNIWHLLFTFVQKMNFPSSCASSERYLWSFLDDIYCCSAEIRNEFAEVFIPFKSRAENAHCPEITSPATGRFDWDRKFGVEFLDDAKIFEICKVCANVTSLCPMLIEDWVSILKTITAANKILGSKIFEYGSPEFLKYMDVTENANYFPLGVLVSTLISRNCLRVETFTIHVAMHVLMPLYRRIVPESPTGTNISSTCNLQMKQKKSISAFVSDLLFSVCQQEWLKNKLIQPCNFLDKGLFLNRMLTPAQAQKMLRIVCRLHTENDLMDALEKCVTKKEILNKVLQNLSIWNINASFLDIELLVKQTESSAGLQELDELIAKAAIDVFCSPDDTLNASTSYKKALNQQEDQLADITSAWLIAPLMSKLQPSVQGRVLKAAAMVLENGHFKKDRASMNAGAFLLGQQPFLSLVLTCLRGQEDQREGLLGSLLRQLQEYCVQAKNDRFQRCNSQDNIEMLDSLRLRLSLVGGMFDTVCKSSSIEAWALLLVQLILYNVITPEGNQQLFNTCCDMLCILIHSCLLPDLTPGGGERTIDDGKKSYNNISKKLKKEIGDRYIPALKAVYQLLPIPRQFHEVIACEIYGSQPSSAIKGCKTSTPTPSTMTVDSTSRKGLQATGKERISPWDLIEGYRSDSATSKWSLFQATRVDLQPETAVGQVNKLVQHEHYHYFKRPAMPGGNCGQNDDYFLQPLNVQYDPCKIQQMRSGFAPACFVDQAQNQRRQMTAGIFEKVVFEEEYNSNI